MRRNPARDPTQRRRNTNWARRRRDAHLQRQMIGRTRCPKRYGPQVCGGLLYTETDGNGTSRIVCELCERVKHHVCIECNRPTASRGPLARRCVAHLKTARTAAYQRWGARHADEKLAMVRRYNAWPEVREKKCRYKRVWRKLNPEKVKAQKRRESLRHSPHRNSYHARYRKRHREHYRLRQLARYYRLHPERPQPVCVKCGRPIPWIPPGQPPIYCLRCVFPSVRKLREAATAKKLAAWTARQFVKPKPVRPPPHVYMNDDGTHRCLGEGCAAALTGRQKKCERCKQRDLAAAAKLALSLGVGTGRGRRNDRRRAA